ncbi:hypothetical protein H9Q09_02725 [Aurantimonas sp. DM33-3]|uniref:hypothetical protein n=1 Tax=Aurantimonas sp. DM33-3 TaxID=2766955 RepID=UPI001651B9F6|nr:hypothetical protein [Aurantimonas sp. DM33-3]MBC6715100.1 hypothetical protein [Aurantimonas sp. DM33-3]
MAMPPAGEICCTRVARYHAFAEAVVLGDDDVADDDADPHRQRPPVLLAVGKQRSLEARRPLDGVHGAAEFDEHAVAAGLEDVAAELADGGAHEPLVGAFDRGEGCGFVSLDQTGKAFDIQ